MNAELAQQQLNAQINPGLVANLGTDFDGCIGLCVADEQLSFQLRSGEFRWLTDATLVDARFHFTTWDDALALLSGTEDLMQAFVESRIRADGYLIWTFTLLALFRC